MNLRALSVYGFIFQKFNIRNLIFEIQWACADNENKITLHDM